MIDRMNRRHFLQNAGLGIAGLAVLSRNRLVFGNPYNLPIGLQLYTVEDHISKDIDGTLARVAEIGYREVEIGGFRYYGQKPAELRRKLVSHGLKPISTHCTARQLKSLLEMTIADAKDCGVTYIGLSALDTNDRTPDAIPRVADWFNQVGETVRDAGCHFVYHGHNFDFEDLGGGVVLYDELIRRTDPKKVGFELDCFWCVAAGKDPVDYFKRFPGRFPQLHIKDMKRGYPQAAGGSSRNQWGFTEVGQGIIDWKKIFRAAPQGGVEHFYVEQDVSERDTLESAQMSYTYLHNLTI